MTREQVAEEKRRLIRVQASVLRASKEPRDPCSDDMIEAVAQLTLTVSVLLKELEEKT